MVEKIYNISLRQTAERDNSRRMTANSLQRLAGNAAAQLVVEGRTFEDAKNITIPADPRFEKYKRELEQGNGFVQEEIFRQYKKIKGNVKK